jgi:Spy/CpxP family protein refolding chaperone
LYFYSRAALRKELCGADTPPPLKLLLDREDKSRALKVKVKSGGQECPPHTCLKLLFTLYKTLLRLTDSLPPPQRRALLIITEDVQVPVVEATGGAHMKSTYFKTAAVVLVLAVMAAIALSQTAKRHMRGDGMFGGPMLGFYVHQLDLTDAQRAQVKAIMTKEKPTLQPLMLQMAQGHSQLRDLVMSGTFDEGKARELASQQSQAMTELAVQHARIASEMVQVLTPEQKTKLTALISQHDQRMMNRMQGKTPGQTQSQ